MLATVTEIEIKTGATIKTVKYFSKDVAKIKAAGAKSVKQISIHETTKGMMYALIGVNSGGELMDEPFDLVALPCPPFCPKGSTDADNAKAALYVDYEGAKAQF